MASNACRLMLRMLVLLRTRANRRAVLAVAERARTRKARASCFGLTTGNRIPLRQRYPGLFGQPRASAASILCTAADSVHSPENPLPYALQQYLVAACFAAFSPARSRRNDRSQATFARKGHG